MVGRYHRPILPSLGAEEERVGREGLKVGMGEGIVVGLRVDEAKDRAKKRREL